MLIVVDANVVFSALIRRGNPRRVFELNEIFERFEFVAPEFLFEEIDKDFGRILSETKLSPQELSETLSFIKEQTELIPASEYLYKLPEARALNVKDSPYLALALALNCPIFSGDKGLREQSKVKVFSPRELLNILGVE